MGFFTEFFQRPRPGDEPLRRGRFALVRAISLADRLEIAVRPADFPRIGRLARPRPPA